MLVFLLGTILGLFISGGKFDSKIFNKILSLTNNPRSLEKNGFLMLKAENIKNGMVIKSILLTGLITELKSVIYF